MRAPSSCRRGSQRIPPVSCRASPLGPPVPVIKSNKTQRGPDQSKHSCYSSHVGGRIRVLTWSVPATTSAIPCPKRVLVKPVKGALPARARTLATRMATAGGFTYQLFLVQSNAKVHTPAPPPPLSKHQMKTHHLPIAAGPSLSWQTISPELSSRGRIINQ